MECLIKNFKETIDNFERTEIKIDTEKLIENIDKEEKKGE